MKFIVNGEQVDGKAYSMGYANDILDGVLLDLPENYSYLSDHVEAHRLFQDDIEEGVEHFDLTETDVDFSKAPHKWVLDSLVKIVIQSAELLCQEECG